MLNGLLALCVLSSPHGVCEAEKDFLDEPSWATPEWQTFASHIVAGEIPHGCKECALVTACTIRRDVERGWNPWHLQERWYGWKAPTKLSDSAVKAALIPMGCLHVPDCKFLGNQSDYDNNWAPQPRIEYGNEYGKSICVLWESEKNKSESTTPKPDLTLFHGIGVGASTVIGQVNATYTR